MAGMTRRILLATTVLCVIFAVAALAADISGNWSGTMQMGDNPVALTFVFKQDGEKLTGTVSTPSGDLPLSEAETAAWAPAEGDGGAAQYLEQLRQLLLS